MNRNFKINNNILRLYDYENNSWQRVIQMQVNEIPEMEKLLESSATSEKNANEYKTIEKNWFYNQMEKQLSEMELINKAIGDQQKRLNEGNTADINTYINAYCMQDILRERIKGTENKYIELRCNFMSYLSNLD
jgi:hypothetical protein